MMEVLIPDGDAITDFKLKDVNCSLDELKVDDLYVRYKKLQKTLELLEVLAEYIKDEQHDLKK